MTLIMRTRYYPVNNTNIMRKDKYGRVHQRAIPMLFIEAKV